jgi:hypothetical protein
LKIGTRILHLIDPLEVKVSDHSIIDFIGEGWDRG